MIDHLGKNKNLDTQVTCPWAAELGKALAALPETYYPNKVNLRNPWIVYDEEQDGCIKLTLSMGKKSPKPKTFAHHRGMAEFTVRALYCGDSVTRSFKLPYSGPGQNK